MHAKSASFARATAVKTCVKRCDFARRARDAAAGDARDGVGWLDEHARSKALSLRDKWASATTTREMALDARADER